MADRAYIAIDLKSFYASVEAKERGLDPLTTNLVVADASRTEKTICLAVTPSFDDAVYSVLVRLPDQTTWPLLAGIVPNDGKLSALIPSEVLAAPGNVSFEVRAEQNGRLMKTSSVAATVNTALPKGPVPAGVGQAWTDHLTHLVARLDLDIPKVFIEGDYLTGWNGKADERAARLSYRSAALNFDCALRMKPQGTSSLNYPKKNFTVYLHEDDALEKKKNVIIRKNYESGAAIPILTFGYSIVKGTPKINPDEAATVRLIFEKHLQGMGLWSIAQMLDSLGIKPPYARCWGALTIRYILRNERYVGDLLLQKTFINDHLSKKKRINRGELPRYYVSGAYPAIIPHEIFERSRQLAELNAERFTPINACSHELLSGRLICARCGKPYKRKVAHERAAWNCGTFMRKGKAYCHGKQIPEDTLLELTEDVLGEHSFQDIHQILVPEPNHLRYIFKDGAVADRTWRDKSRRDSWNEDMRRQAAEHTSRRWAK